MIENTYGSEYNRYPGGTSTKRGRNVNRIQPAIDRAIAPASGATRDGQPISYNRAPAADLAPWISRLYLARIAAPVDYRLDCGLFNDGAFLRIQPGGVWRVETAQGIIETRAGALWFGPHSQRMKVQVIGSLLSFGFGLCPGASQALGGFGIGELVDNAATCEELGSSSDPWLAIADQAAAPGAVAEDVFCALETVLRGVIDCAGARAPDAITQRFELAAYIDPTISVADFARDNGIEQRRLERIVKRDFGFTPKAVLRHARALDFASLLRGVADETEAESLALRYYDQSHLIRDFTGLFGMSPRQFARLPQPLMTSALENRQARRLEMLDRIAPGAIRPWE